MLHFIRRKTASAPERRAAASPFPLVALDLAGRAAWTTRNYAALAQEGYARNAIVYRCVRMIAEGAAAVPWALYEGAHLLDRHDLLDLLARPNFSQSGREFMENWYAYLQLSGNAYMEAVQSDGQVRELHALRPDRVRVVVGARGWPVAWDHTVGGRTMRHHRSAGFSPILHQRLFHPTDDHYGMSPLEAAAYGVDIHNAAGAWNKALLDNAARPSGALVYKGGDGAGHLTDRQYTRLRRELEETYQGATNAGRPMLLEGLLEWTTMGLTPKDMDFIEAKHVAAREIALAFGVPPMLLGIPGDNTYANFAEASRSLWRQTILPLVGRTAGALSTWLAPRFGDRLRLWYDPDKVEALSVEREALWARVRNADFLTVNEKREAVGYGPLPGGDQIDKDEST